MSANLQERPHSAVDGVIRVVKTALIATFLTAFVGAIENWFYERFFAPELYAAGNPAARAGFTLVLTYPYILVGFVLLGLPIDYVLARVRVETALAYALAGAAAGVLWGKIAVGFSSTYGIAISAFYGCLCALLWWWLRPRP